MPASDPPSPSSDGAKSSRVCLNCRRKKKKCDKKLPSCGRCTYSLEYCQHEDDPRVPGHSEVHASTGFDMFASVHPQVAFPVGPFVESQHASFPLHPVLFSTLENCEDIHHFVCRSLNQVIGDQSTIESVVKYYFQSVNSWFTVVERANFEERLQQMWSEPSAEVGLLLLCMLLVIRTPDDNFGASMQNSLYFSVKSTFSVVEAKVSLSVPLLQAKLLIALYELIHLMPQQAYMSVGSCVQMCRAFGWLEESFWAADRQLLSAAELKLYSILWWAISFLDSGLNVENHGYPLNVGSIAFQIPLPEHFDQFLQSSSGDSYDTPTSESLFKFADDGDDKIETIVWPEAKSASYLVQVIQHLNSPEAFSMSSRDELSETITAHARDIVSRPWKGGNRCAALSVAYIAILKLNHPWLADGQPPASAFNPRDRKAVENVLPVVASICNIAQVINSMVAFNLYGPMTPAGAYCIQLAALLLIHLGDTAMQDPEWPSKVDSLLRCLDLFLQKWQVTEKHIHAVNYALSAKMGQGHVRYTDPTKH